MSAAPAQKGKGKEEAEEPPAAPAAPAAAPAAAAPADPEGLVETAGQRKARQTFEALAPPGYAPARPPELRAALREAGAIYARVPAGHQQAIWKSARTARQRAARAAAGAADGPLAPYRLARAQGLAVAAAIAEYTRDVQGSAAVFRRVAVGSAASLLVSGLIGAAVLDEPPRPRAVALTADPEVARGRLSEFFAAM